MSVRPWITVGAAAGLGLWACRVSEGGALPAQETLGGAAAAAFAGAVLSTLLGLIVLQTTAWRPSSRLAAIVNGMLSAPVRAVEYALIHIPGALEWIADAVAALVGGILRVVGGALVTAFWVGCLGAYVQAILTCIATNKPILLLVGLFIPPIGIIHGLGIWFAGW